MPSPAQTRSLVHTLQESRSISAGTLRGTVPRRAAQSCPIAPATRFRFPRPLLVALCTALLSQAAHALSYAPATTYATGSGPLFAASADFNGDGKPDLAVANYLSDTLSVLLNNGNGTFAAAINYAVGAGPDFIAIGDFDGDGKLDLAVTNDHSNNVSILRGNGSGSFAAAVNYAAGTEPAGIVTGDLDGDGDLDLVVVNFLSNNVSILLNNGDGTFAPRVDYAAGSLTISVALGDFDGDGDLDLAVTSANTDTVSILLNNGNGTFAPKVDYATGNFPLSVAVGDFDADGDLDLAVINADANSVSILLNNGGGTFASTSPPIAVGGRATHVAIANLDAGGRLDLAVANFTGDSVSIVLGNGNGTFQAALNLAAGIGSIARVVGVSDVNGDGRPDLFVANQNTGDVSVYLAIPVPSAPTIGTATPGNAQVFVAFTPPVFSGDGPVLDYTATCGTRSATGTASPILVSGLVNGTTYSCTVTARNAVGSGVASRPSNLVRPGTTSFSGPSTTGSGTITASFTGGGANCTFLTAQFIGPPPGSGAVPPTAPPGVSFPHGLFDFTMAGCTAGSTLAFTIAYPQVVTGTQYWKYGPRPGNPRPDWYVLPATIAGNTVTFTITDGGLGDDDLTANGTIVDQGGPGVPIAAAVIPTLSEWAMLLLASLVMLAGMGTLRRRA